MRKKYLPLIANSSGFSLLELIVVFSVIAIISTIGIVSFVSYSQSQTIQEGAQSISSALNLARSRSLSQVKPSQCATLVLQGNRVVITPSSRSYRLEVVCSGTGFTIEDYTLPQGITFDAGQTTTYSVYYPILTFGVRGAGNIVLRGFNLTRTVVVDAQGGAR